MSIPRIFHRIWLGAAPMPQEFADYGQTWQEHHPHWEMRLWTEENMPVLRNLHEFERSSGWSGKANVLRYEVLYQQGGVYVDTDLECLKPLDDILQDKTFVAGWSSAGVVNNAFIAATPRHEILRQCVQSLPDSFKENEGRGSFHQSGPYFLSHIIQRFSESREDLGQAILPPQILYPHTWEQKYLFKTQFDPSQFPQAYAVHHWASSWQTC